MSSGRERLTEGPLAGTSRWTLRVAAREQITPAMLRIRLHHPELDDLGQQPGQDLMVAVPTGDGATVNRRYSIRRVDPVDRMVDLEIVAHVGDGPGARWVRAVRPGDEVEAIGPRGKVLLVADAPWHLFFGDETTIAATLSMLEAVGEAITAVAFLEVDGAEDEQPFAAPPWAQLTWVHRRDDGGSALVDAARTVDLPSGEGHAYLNGELTAVQALRAVLTERGMAPEQLSVKPYWRRGVDNLAHGEPPRD